MITEIPEISTVGPTLHHELALELMILSMQRHDGLLSAEQYAGEVESIRRRLPSKWLLSEHPLPEGGTRFALRHHTTGELLDEYEFQHGDFAVRLSFK